MNTSSSDVLNQRLLSIAESFKDTDLDNLQRRDDKNEFDTLGWKRCAENGLMGLPIPERYGGEGFSISDTAECLKELGYVCHDNGLIFSLGAHLWGGTVPILSFGTEKQKTVHLPGLCDGSKIAALAISEDEAGSDAYSLTTHAKHENDTYKLNGKKIFVTNAPIADVFIVIATVDSSKGRFGLTAFLVDPETPGLHISNSVLKMGLRSAQMSELIFDDCIVPENNVLGGVGGGMALFNHAMEWERGLILAPAIGSMKRLLEMSVQRARTRKQFGQSIGSFQLIATKLVDMRMRLEFADALISKVAKKRDEGQSSIEASAMAKLYISEAWIESCRDALQIHGGYGYLVEAQIERQLRDAYGSTLYSGTSEIQRLIIARMMKVT